MTVERSTHNAEVCLKEPVNGEIALRSAPGSASKNGYSLEDTSPFNGASSVNEAIAPAGAIAPARAPLPFDIKPAEARLWHLDGPCNSDKRWRRKIFKGIPEEVADALADQYEATWQTKGRAAANAFLLDTAELFKGGSLRLAASDESLRAYARNRADEGQRILSAAKSIEAAYPRLAAFVENHGFLPPEVKAPKVSMKGAVLRMVCERWWRRQVRRAHGRKIEHQARLVGLVNASKGLYASDYTVGRRREQKQRNRALLSVLHAVNDAGELFSLEELAALSVSNPKIRRGELMVRIRGFEDLAKTREDAALMLTFTCPSRFHRWHRESNTPNSNYDETTPREAQQWLSKQWSKIRSTIHRKGIRPYGFRIAEPHHDGTPHWHLLAFVAPEHEEFLVETCRRFLLSESPNERGAKEHRFQVTRIDASKGSATGYIAKYVSKNISGEHVSEDFEAAKPVAASRTAERVEAWASAWGIRQFQQFGGPPVSLWRECRRLSADSLEGFLADVVKAAGGSNWAEFVTLLGGPEAKRNEIPLKLWHQETNELGIYGDAMGAILKGIAHGDATVTTRTSEWTLIPITRPVSNRNNPSLFNRGSPIGTSPPISALQ